MKENTVALTEPIPENWQTDSWTVIVGSDKGYQSLQLYTFFKHLFQIVDGADREGEGLNNYVIFLSGT